MMVGDLMTRKVRTCRDTDTLADVAQRIYEGDCGCVPVVSSDGSSRVIGMITDRDICMATHFRRKRPSEISIADAMTRTVHTIGPFESIANAETLMRDAQVRRLPVVDREQRLVGLVSLADLARGAHRPSQKSPSADFEVGRTLSAITRARQPKLLTAYAS